MSTPPPSAPSPEPLPAVARETSADPAPRSATRVFLLALVGFLLLSGAWAVATPPFASPDEQYHVSRASSVARGLFISPGNGRYGGGAGAVVEARGVARAAAQWRCLQFDLDQNATCAKDASPDPTPLWVFSGAARYAPAYYAVIGWPSLMIFDADVVIAMRLVSAAWCAAMLAAALTIALRSGRRRWLGLGVVVAATPMVAFLSGTINPNAVEISGAILAWVAGLAIVTAPGRAPTSWYVGFSLGATSLVLMRQLSPFWLLGILAACVIVAGLPRLRELRASRRTYRWLALPLVGTLLQMLWTFGIGTDDVPVGAKQNVPVGFTLWGVLDRQTYRWKQYVGNFGWLDIPLPWWAGWAWLALWAGLFVLAFLRGWGPARGRGRWALGLVLLGVLVVPVLLEWPLTHRIGYYWQGRYALPIAVGVPLVACALLALSPRVRAVPARLFGGVLALVALVHVWAFVKAFARYSGSGETPSIFGPWQPPVPFLLLAACVLGAVALLGALAASRRPVGTVGTVGTAP